MLNVKAVQDNLSNEYKDALKRAMSTKNKRDIDWMDRSTLDKIWSGSSLPRTCSAVEIGQPSTKAELADLIAAKLRTKNKYIQCSSISSRSNMLLEEFGFTKVTDYMGNHGYRVHIYYLNLSNYKF